jgi:hypothetical protein
LENKDLTFAPKLAVRSEQMVQRAREAAVYGRADTRVLQPVEERLRASSRELRASRSDLHQSRESRDVPDAPGASRRIEGFLKRQEEFAAAREANRENVKNEAEEPCTFQPRICTQSEVLVEANHKLWGESQKDRTERLAVGDPKRRSDIREQLGKDMYAECSFQPKVSEVPAFVAKRPNAKVQEEEPGDVHEKLHKATTTAARKEEVEKPIDSECTFAPKVDYKKYSRVKSHYDFSDPELAAHIVDELKDRAHRRAEGARTKDERELKDCTFKPNVPSGRRVEADGPVVVRGLGRYLELKELARKQNAPVEKKPERVGSVTIPEPFQLSTANLRLHRASPSEPSFQPVTNESQRRAKVRQIMEERGFRDAMAW